VKRVREEQHSKQKIKTKVVNSRKDNDQRTIKSKLKKTT